MNAVNELRQILSEDQVTVNPTILEQHSRDESYHTPHLPDVVVYSGNSIWVGDQFGRTCYSVSGRHFNRFSIDEPNCRGTS